jgi:vacuolar protein sorting-associated protein 26
MAGYFFASPVDVEVRLEGEDGRKIVDVKPEKEKDKSISAPVYYDGDSIAGQVREYAG